MPTKAVPEAALVPNRREIAFGPFRLQPERQLLLRADKPVRIGARALEILIALVERAGELVTKEELVARVWPNLLVTEGNLRTQIALLRRALGGGADNARYLVAVSGRGYRFVAPVSNTAPPEQRVPSPPAAERPFNLPRPLSRVIGRKDVVSTIGKRLERRRFITVVGPGGIGKTTVALSVANDLQGSYRHGACFIDLAPVSGSLVLAGVVASALGLTVVSEDPTSTLIAFLRNRHVLLVLDSCEHVLEAASILAEAMLRGAPDVHVLATSREPLRAEGESVYHLAPLETPPAGAELTADEALTFAAVELFVERASSSNQEFALNDENVSAVTNICRKLDGMALAIELAAGRIDIFGAHSLSEQLDDRFRLLMQGRRTALPRHRTLSAALDWSYQFLPDVEKAVLPRLAAFVGGFTLDAAQAVAADKTAEASEVLEAVANLVAKSLVYVDAKGAVAIYRLLDTTRAYAAEKLRASGEFERTALAHATYYLGVLERAEMEAETKPLEEWLASYGRQIDNVRKALDWAFSAQGDPALSVALTIAALPLWMHFSLMGECRSRVEQALASLQSTANAHPRLEMQLLHALGAVLLNIEAAGAEMEQALTKALSIADTLDETDYRLRTLWCLWCNALNRGAFREALTLAERFCGVAKRSPDPVDPLTGERMRGFVLHFLGDQDGARSLIEYMLSRYVAPVHRSHIIRFQFDQEITARNFLVQILWLQGFPDRSSKLNEANIAEALAFNHTLSLCNALAKAACPVALMNNNLAAAERFIELLQDRAARNGLPMWHAWGNCFKGILSIKQGAIGSGLDLLRETLAVLPENRFSLRLTWVLGEYADGLRRVGRIADGLRMIDQALEIAARDEELWCLPELLRTRGELLQAEGGGTADQAAEELFLQALDCAHRQKALAWELRTALSLARLRLRQDRHAEAHSAIVPVYRRFTEGFETTDLQSAKNLINQLSALIQP